MNSNELANLLSINPPNSTPRRSTRSQTMLSEQSRKCSPTKLPACDKSQSKHHGRRHRRNYPISLNYNPQDDQHEDVHQVHSRVLRSSPTATQTSTSSLRQIAGEPDFMIEEREAWSRNSPISTVRGPLRKRNEPAEFTLYDESGGASTDDEGYGHTQRQLPAFAPLPGAVGIKGRPKTSRGPETINVALQQDVELSQAQSRFVEGSMSSRSAAVSSSWSQYSSDYEASESETDQSDITPKASHARRSSSIDLQDFQPPPVSAFTLKRTFFRRRRDDKTDDERRQVRIKESKKEKGAQKKPRKSMSNWNLRAVGEKIGLLNNSSTSVDDAADVAVPSRSPSRANILDERKRKAEAAYAQQFESKKQKHNPGNAYMSEPDQPVTMRRRTAAADANSTIRARHGSGSQHGAESTTISRKVSLNSHDLRKQQSIKELQKENQILRNLLQEQQAAQDRTITKRSRSGIPRATALPTPYDSDSSVNAGGVPPVPALNPARKALESVAKTHDNRPDPPGKTDTTPVILMTNHPVLKPTPASRLQPSISAGRKLLPPLPRPVSMIIEEPEGESGLATINQEQEIKPKAKFVLKNATKKGLGKRLEIGKENEIATNEVVALKESPGRAEGWKGWDEDVF